MKCPLCNSDLNQNHKQDLSCNKMIIHNGREMSHYIKINGASFFGMQEYIVFYDLHIVNCIDHNGIKYCSVLYNGYTIMNIDCHIDVTKIIHLNKEQLLDKFKIYQTFS